MPRKSAMRELLYCICACCTSASRFCELQRCKYCCAVTRVHWLVQRGALFRRSALRGVQPSLHCVSVCSPQASTANEFTTRAKSRRPRTHAHTAVCSVGMAATHAIKKKIGSFGKEPSLRSTKLPRRKCHYTTRCIGGRSLTSAIVADSSTCAFNASLVLSHWIASTASASQRGMYCPGNSSAP